jgi:hypothetical protein
MWLSGQGKTMEKVKRFIVSRDWMEGEMNRWNTQDFENREILFVCNCRSHYTSSQTHRMQNPKNEPKGKV